MNRKIGFCSGNIYGDSPYQRDVGECYHTIGSWELMTIPKDVIEDMKLCLRKRCIGCDRCQKSKAKPVHGLFKHLDFNYARKHASTIVIFENGVKIAEGPIEQAPLAYPALARAVVDKTEFVFYNFIVHVHT